ncbi:hypothetical protein AOQ84DRAFT_73101 [Glonium stellatum]|uniref:Uncharacterized protein n=1 Tax=Glonium stellatum TaxID=574774 RepID=A0A8E2JRD2_9PEZI|nr:hypothetical protein AOQ84DRAFT_73101 [Glonium stellatum]
MPPLPDHTPAPYCCLFSHYHIRPRGRIKLQLLSARAVRLSFCLLVLAATCLLVQTPQQTPVRRPRDRLAFVFARPLEHLARLCALIGPCLLKTHSVLPPLRHLPL